MWTPPDHSSDKGWRAADGRLIAGGTDLLSTNKEFGPCELIFDWKVPARAGKRECVVSIGGRKRTVQLPDGAKPGSWHRQTLKTGNVAGPGPIRFLPSAGLEIMNLFVREVPRN